VALTKSINRDFYDGDLQLYPLAAAVKIYKGAAVGENAAGYARPLVAGDKFLGFSQEEVDNTDGAAGALKALVRRRGAISLPVTSLVITDNDGVAIYASDDGTFVKTAAGNSYIGQCRFFEESGIGIVEYDASRPAPTGIIADAVLTVGEVSNNAITVGIQLKDALGNDLAIRGAVHAYLSSNANGDALEAASGTLAVAGGTDGVLIETSTDNGFLLISEADGDIDVTVTQTAADAHYLVLVLPDGRLKASAVLTFPGE
jgi:hypothetical protein